MSKILAIADVHIHDYPNRNPDNKYRLYQTRKVAENIISVGKSEGADILVIAGDLLEKSIVRPYVQAEVKLFLDTVMSEFTRGFIIWGNHDQDNKGNDQDFTDSCLSVMLPPNMQYVDGKRMTIDNTDIAFSNWRPEFDLSWITGKVDVLFTHATICYTAQDQVKSQVLDESKFDLAICGDIHRPGQLGKYVSIGIPQKCKMGDFDECTGVVFDCVSKSWSWVNLNPTDNLMKFKYTPVRTSEGWHPDTGTWEVYKPENLGITDGVRDIKVPAWEEVGNLIDSIIVENELTDVHGEVLKHIKNVEAKEVDFNFTLTRFYCKNWRSIDEVELFFDNRDRILITGHNGSGKSSLLSAIRYALEENRFLKDFIQIGTKECVTEIDFLYQGCGYRIQRGSKKYGLWINGEPQKYNNKKEFEADVRQRFPFIDYMKVYFFDSDHHKLLGSITPEEKSDIISKFFKMDRIDAYNDEASRLLDYFERDSASWKSEISEATRLRDFIIEKLNSQSVPEIDRDTLTGQKQYGLDLQRKSKDWSDYQLFTASENARLQNLQSGLVEKTEHLKTLMLPGVLDMKIAQIQETLSEIGLKISELGSIDSEYSLKYNQYQSINTEGTRLYNEWSHIEDKKTCPCCGQVLQNTESIDRHKAELEARLTELGEQKNTLISELTSLKERKLQADTKKAELSAEMSRLNDTISTLKSDKLHYESVQLDISRCQSEIQNVEQGLSRVVAPEEVYLPENFMETMARIESDIKSWDIWNSLMIDKAASEEKIQKCQDKLTELSHKTSDLQRYIKITGPTGKIYEEIMNRLADQFSDNQVKYEVVTYTFRNKEHLDLISSFKNNGNWITYQACSSGQQTVLDINFLSKVVTGVGLLVMDEFLKHLDPANHEICIDLIKSMNIGCTMISSHMESLASFNNKSCTLELNESGVTKITLT